MHDLPYFEAVDGSGVPGVYRAIGLPSDTTESDENCGQTVASAVGAGDRSTVGSASSVAPTGQLLHHSQATGVACDQTAYTETLMFDMVVASRIR